MSYVVPISIAVLIFLAVVAVAGIVADYKKRRLELEPLRAAIERGQQLDPAIIERLMSRDSHHQASDPREMRAGGIITIASGIGIGLLALFVAQVAPVALYPILGAGVLAICVGIGLLISARIVGRSAV